MSEAQLLRPIKPDLPPECAAFVSTLRELFGGLDISVRRYAARRHRDPGSISRFLNGSRVPPWEFVEDLLRDLAEAQQNPVKPEVFGHVRDQHRQALRVSNAGLYELQVLSDQLEQADREQRQAAVKEQALLEALQARQRRIAELEVDRRQLESDWAAERLEKENLAEIHANKTQDYAREIDQLRQEIEDLRVKLREADALNEAAEMRCKLLEEQLEELESKYDSNPPEAPFEDAQQETVEQEITLLQEPIDELREIVNGKSVQEIISEIIEREAYDSNRPSRLYDAIAAYGDIRMIKEVSSGLFEAAQQTAVYGLLRSTLHEGPVEVVYAFLDSVANGSLIVGDYRIQDMLLWFTYDSGPDRIVRLLRQLREERREEWATFLLHSVGQAHYGDAVKVRDVVARVDANDTQSLLSVTARNVEVDKFPRVLRVLRDGAMEGQAKWLIAEFVKERAAEVPALKNSLRLLGAADDLRDLEWVVAE